MAVNGIGALQYRNVYNQTNSRVESNSEQPEKAAVQDKIDFSADSLAQSAALRSFRGKYPALSISVGSEMNYSKDRKTGTVAVNEHFLNKAMNDPEAAKTMSDLIYGIDKAEKTVAAYYNSLGGVTERTSHWYIDENGNCYNFSYTRRDDKLNKKLREEAEKDRQERIERSIEKNRDAEEVRLEEAAEDEETAESDEEIESESVGKSMGINAAKLARMLAAAKTRSQVQAVMDMIQSDLRECDAGKEQGYDVDEASVSAAESLLEEAKSRMSSAEDREPTPQEEMATALASLM